MTNYLLGECIEEFARVEPNENSYGPSFQHVFDDEVSTKYLKLILRKNGTQIIRYMDLTTRCYVDISEISDPSTILDLENALTEE